MNTSNPEKFIELLKSYFKLRTDEDLAVKLDMTQPAITHWRRRGIPKKVLRKYEQIISGAGEERVHTENQTTKKDVNKMDDFALELARDKIESQKKEIQMYKEALQKKQAESTYWDGVEYDFITEVKLKRRGFKLGRTVTSVSNLDIQAKMLGYNENELNALWNIDVEYDDFKEHPVNAIVCNNTQKELHSISERLPSLLDALKLMVGEHYIPVGINYINKDGSHVPAISYNKVMWINLTVISKIKFLTIDNE